MGAFEYSAIDGGGRTRKGVLQGDGPGAVRAALREQGLMPLTVEPVREKGVRAAAPGDEGAARPARSLGGGGVKIAELSLATRQLATLMRAGQPVADALKTVTQQTENKRLKRLLPAVRARVEEGRSLADALAEFPQTFNDLYRETVAAGEATGQLDTVFERLADYLEKGAKLKQTMIMAMIYPSLVLVFAIAVSTALLAYVVPEVVSVFADFDQELPAITQVVIALSDFLRENGAVLAAAVAGAVIVLRLMMRRPAFRRRWHALLLRLPVAGRLARSMNTAQFARTFGILVASGVPALEGLRVAARVIANLPMRSAVQEAARKVREGGSLYQSLDESRMFTPLVIHLIASGEASGRLDEMLDRAASAQENEVETLAQTLTSLLEPLMILFMGGLVLSIVVAILLPIFDLNQLVQ
ncbi:type II secretion system inner membrane protein GspF [Magnetofaba australis]|uniref:Putative general secretion pathway protein F n=1 Tax=Magnetofaba australis IT-1 TaxID=1434232 RepID=A0A1Y2K706_9PROT|nr:type II secretion system inner membrane protein GspF [Magnetofaba australis]OSM05333.1 putative general secretion pathway protein F [Magnetofaba australis IT-1]